MGSSNAAAELSSVGSAVPLICVLFSMVDGKLKVYVASSFLSRPHKYYILYSILEAIHLRDIFQALHLRFLLVTSDTHSDHFVTNKILFGV